MDFLRVSERSPKKEITEIYPKFRVGTSTDLMTRGGDFYAFWNESEGHWSTDLNELVKVIDSEIKDYADKYRNEHSDKIVRPMYMWDGDSGSIDKWNKFVTKQLWDNYHELDENLTFANTEVTKESYVSRKLPYPLEKRPIPAYEELISSLYSPEERRKLEWAIGCIVSGDSKKVQKFVVMYGAPKTGKSTILNVIQEMFAGYWKPFDAKALGSASNSFAFEAFRDNPLIAIQHDGDLSHIEDNTRLNSLVSHETVTVNVKNKSTYPMRFNSFLFMGTNKPVRITDAKSGIIRRLIDVSPTGNRIQKQRYEELMSQIKFELGGIAQHCLDIYLGDKRYYDDYIPISMMGASNSFYNFMLDSFDAFKRDDGTSQKDAWEMYKVYNQEANVFGGGYSLMLFKEELKSYFRNFYDRYTKPDGTRVWNYYEGFLTEKFEYNPDKKLMEEAKEVGFPLECSESLFDQIFSDCPAQYATANGTPMEGWAKVKTKLSDINPGLLHYVNIPEELNVVCVDFDLKGPDGKKCFKLNAEEARKWPATYAELSKGGEGIHLIYYYDGDPSELSAIYSPNVEIKTFTGGQSLRRRLTRCNDIPIATLNAGLPKKEKKVIDWKGFKDQEDLMRSIGRNLKKLNAPHCTKSSIDYIYNDLESAYAAGFSFDVTPVRPAVMSFAAKSTHNSDYCLKVVTKMKWMSKDMEEKTIENEAPKALIGFEKQKNGVSESDLVFYDVEVFPNLFVIVWKAMDKEPVIWINPSADQVTELCRSYLVGFNNRDYDNHILYARMLKFTEHQLYEQSQRIISGSPNAKFGGAYDLSYTDIYDFASTKQSLKKWEIAMGIHHLELGLPWDQPVPEELWEKVSEYCVNDVVATEALFKHLKADWTARKILAELAGMTVNDTTNSLTTRIIFGKERHPQLVYTDLATGEQFGPPDQCTTDPRNAFPGYFYGTFTDYYTKYPEYLPEGKTADSFISDTKMRNLYRGVDLGKGGYVYAKHGIWWMVALLDVTSLHPHSIEAMNCFGKYTKNFVDIKNARIFIKHKDYEGAKLLFGGKLAKFLDDPAQAKALSQALKIAINSVYGLTSAAFDNPFKDSRNVNNIVALRGALFMKTLQDEVTERGFDVAHIKTDSIKIPNATQEIIDFCMDFAKKYGYTFEHEATYERMCLVNNAVYIARYADGEHDFELPTGERVKTAWTATGTQFQVPYVFKNLFSHHPIKWEDMCETKSSKVGALYLNNNEKDGGLSEETLQFIGKVGQFTPVKAGQNGGELVAQRTNKKTNDIQYVAAPGSTGYRWMESEAARSKGAAMFSDETYIVDRGYYDELVTAAVETIKKFGDYEQFVHIDQEDSAAV